MKESPVTAPAPRRRPFTLSGLIALTLMLLASCASTPRFHRAYPEIVYQPQEAAFIITRPQQLTAWDSIGIREVPIRIVSINGRKGFEHGAFDGSVRIEVPPGRHVLEVRLFYTGLSTWRSEENAIIELDAEPGRTYAIDVTVGNGSWQPFVTEVVETSPS
jgi:hypothetical protein